MFVFYSHYLLKNEAIERKGAKMGHLTECMIFSRLRNFNNYIFTRVVSSYFFASIMKNDQYHKLSSNKTESQILM